MKYTLELTKSQLQALQLATEIYARLGIGQIRDAIYALPLDESKGYPPMHEICRDVEAAIAKHTISNVDGYRASLGIHHKDVKEPVKIAWDLYQVIRNRIAWDDAIEKGIVENHQSPRNWSGGMFGVHYDDPLKTSLEPLARICDDN